MGKETLNQPDIHVAGLVIDVAALAIEEDSETGLTTGGGTVAVDLELAGIVTGREDSGETGREALARPGSGRAALGTGIGRSGRREDQGNVLYFGRCRKSFYVVITVVTNCITMSIETKTINNLIHIIFLCNSFLFPEARFKAEYKEIIISMTT